MQAAFVGEIHNFLGWGKVRQVKVQHEQMQICLRRMRGRGLGREDRAEFVGNTLQSLVLAGAARSLL